MGSQELPSSRDNYPQQPPQKPGFLKRKIWCLPVLFFVIFLCSCGSSQQATSTPTQTPTQPTNTPASPTAVPTKQSAINPTHGMPHIGGAISDFYGKYGQPHN